MNNRNNYNSRANRRAVSSYDEARWDMSDDDTYHIPDYSTERQSRSERERFSPKEKLLAVLGAAGVVAALGGIDAYANRMPEIQDQYQHTVQMGETLWGDSEIIQQDIVDYNESHPDDKIIVPDIGHIEDELAKSNPDVVAGSMQPGQRITANDYTPGTDNDSLR